MSNIKQSTAPDYSGLSFRVFDLAAGGVLPTFDTDIATTYKNQLEVGHLDEFSDGGSSRGTRKYTPVNDRKYSEIVSTGSMSFEPFTAKVLYDPEASSEGISKLEEAFEQNKPIGVLLEIANEKTSGSGNGTIYAYAGKVSKFAIGGEKDGKFTADITIEKLGKPVKHEAK